MSEYETIIEGMHLGVSKHLMDKHYTILWANGNAYELTGYTKNEFSSRYQNKVDEYYKEDRETFNRVTRVIEESYYKQKKVYSFECPMRSKRGTVTWIQMNGIFSKETYRGVPIIWNVFFDITDTFDAKKELETARKDLDYELQKMDKMKAWMEAFLIELDYDICSLSNIITGMTDVAEIYFSDQKTCERCLKMIRESSRKLKKRIHKARSIFQEEAG